MSEITREPRTILRFACRCGYRVLEASNREVFCRCCDTACTRVLEYHLVYNGQALNVAAVSVGGGGEEK